MYSTLTEIVNLAKNSSFYPEEFISSMRIIAPQFMNGKHQDCHEFLLLLLDSLETTRGNPDVSLSLPDASGATNVVYVGDMVSEI